MQRLGANGGEEFRAHSFFALIDWAALYNRQISPPFDPMRNNCSELDTNNFEREFTNMPMSLDAGGGDLREGREDSDTFLNFTYEEESHLASLINSRSLSRGGHK